MLQNRIEKRGVRLIIYLNKGYLVAQVSIFHHNCICLLSYSVVNPSHPTPLPPVPRPPGNGSCLWSDCNRFVSGFNGAWVETLSAKRLSKCETPEPFDISFYEYFGLWFYFVYGKKDISFVLNLFMNQKHN